MGNPVTQFQIISKMPEETASFYAALFAWKIDANNPIGYRRIDTGSMEGIQGGIWPAPPQAPTFVQLFVTVPDVKANVDRAVELGAKVIILSGDNYFSLSTTTISPDRRQLQPLQNSIDAAHWCGPGQRVGLCRDAT